MTPMEGFIKERDEAILSLDRERIVAFLRKWGEEPHEDDRIFWAGIHKAIVIMNSSSDEEKQRSRDWLKSNGFDSQA